ncbi:unnamed protein product, partial [Porites lobata]
MQRIKKTAGIASLEVKPVRNEVHRGIRAYRVSEHATTAVILNRLMLGRELRGKFPEKLLKKGCRESPPCDDSESDGAFEPDAVKIDRSCEPPQGPEQSRAGSGGDTVSTDRSSESRQGHEQPGANSD